MKLVQADSKLFVQISWGGKEYVRKLISHRKICPQMYAWLCRRPCTYLPSIKLGRPLLLLAMYEMPYFWDEKSNNAQQSCYGVGPRHFVTTYLGRYSQEHNPEKSVKHSREN
ncbi:hypothetical protein TNCT_624391 [Trichonephila clavata]|uniref:Uncharacterized protein n=1 Tax=Trichonephila clavata TaxID=2740835 RepID=A0A8X6KB69_TRICU|nr:hypothetical protein TNCT_624391 [Trichonephila clavata]